MFGGGGGGGLSLGGGGLAGGLTNRTGGLLGGLNLAGTQKSTLSKNVLFLVDLYHIITTL